jgi:hypothetical protein
MPKKITSLTPEQIAQIPAWAQKWVDIGLDCSPADFDRAEQAVLKCYDLINAPRPKQVLRVSSPWAAIYEGSKANVKLQNGGKKASKKDLNAFIKANWFNYRGAQLWASWFSYVTFFRDVCDWENESLENFKLDEEIALSAGFVWWSDDVVAISDRPKRVSRDAGGRLHNENGKALEYRDGWGVYAWHGYRITQKNTWIIDEKEKITPELIEKETNAELRRIMLEIYGYEKYLAQRKAKEISSDVLHGKKRRLLEFTLANEPIRVVEVINGSQEPDGSYRKFILGCVRRDGRYPETPNEAIAWSYGIPETIYDESVRT